MERTNGFQKAGGGNSSGLGEFWNRELAYNAALAAFDAELCALLEACTKFLRFWLCPGLDFGPNSILSSSLALSEEEEKSSSKDMLNTPSLGERPWCLWRREVGDGVRLVKPAPPKPNGNPEVDERGAVRGPSSYVCCHIALLPLVGVDGGVSPSASVVSSQMGNAPAPPMLDSGEVMGAEREKFIIAERERMCCLPPLFRRGTGIALEDAGVGVLGAAGG